jgi:hypothetical protein
MTTVSFRTDAEIDEALKFLGVTSGNRSKIMKKAILDAAEAELRAQERADAERLANDPEDRAEMVRVMEDMEDLRAW